MLLVVVKFIPFLPDNNKLIRMKNDHDEIPERDIALFCYPSCVQRPRRRGFRGTISVKFRTEVQNGEKILPKVSTPWAGRTNVTDYRQTTDEFAIAKTRM